MRILQVVHGFPPDQMAGAEVYTWSLGREMARRGHDVHVLAPVQRGGTPQGTLIEENVDGMAVLRLDRELRPRRLEETYSDPWVDELFAGLLRRLKPEVVHVQHTIGLSVGVLAVARAAGVPVVMTLHDFWFHCPCHQSRYDRRGIKAAGERYGPAARGMDRFATEVDADGVLFVETGKIVLGPLPIALGQPGLIPPLVENGCV